MASFVTGAVTSTISNALLAANLSEIDGMKFEEEYRFSRQRSAHGEYEAKDQGDFKDNASSYAMSIDVDNPGMNISLGLLQNEETEVSVLDTSKFMFVPKNCPAHQMYATQAPSAELIHNGTPMRLQFVRRPSCSMHPYTSRCEDSPLFNSTGNCFSGRLTEVVQHLTCIPFNLDRIQMRTDEELGLKKALHGAERWLLNTFPNRVLLLQNSILTNEKLSIVHATISKSTEKRSKCLQKQESLHKELVSCRDSKRRTLLLNNLNALSQMITDHENKLLKFNSGLQLHEIAPSELAKTEAMAVRARANQAEHQRVYENHKSNHDDYLDYSNIKVGVIGTPRERIKIDMTMLGMKIVPYNTYHCQVDVPYFASEVDDNYTVSLMQLTDGSITDDTAKRLRSVHLAPACYYLPVKDGMLAAHIASNVRVYMSHLYTLMRIAVSPERKRLYKILRKLPNLCSHHKQEYIKNKAPVFNQSNLVRCIAVRAAIFEHDLQLFMSAPSLMNMVQREYPSSATVIPPCKSCLTELARCHYHPVVTSQPIVPLVIHKYWEALEDRMTTTQ
jgi:hypothetical protein